MTNIRNYNFPIWQQTRLWGKQSNFCMFFIQNKLAHDGRDGSAFVQFSKNNNWLSFETFALADVSQIKNGIDVILSYHHWIKGSVSQLIQIIWGMRLSFCVISLHGLFQFCLLLLKCMNVCSVMHCYELHISMLCAWIFIIVGWN